MSDQPNEPLTDEQQHTMDGVEDAIDDARKAEADLRAVDPGALVEPTEQPNDEPAERDLEA